MEESLLPSQRKTYERVFAPESPADLRWGAVRSLLLAISRATTHANGAQRLERRGRYFLLHPEDHNPNTSVTAAQLATLRRFLEGPSNDVAATGAQGASLVVVLDDRVGRIYKFVPRGVEPARIESYDPRGAGRVLHYAQDDAAGGSDSTRESFHQALARALRGAGRITLIGRGKRAKPALERLEAYLRTHHDQLPDRVLATASLTAEATDDELLDKVKRLHVEVRVPGAAAEAESGTPA